MITWKILPGERTSSAKVLGWELACVFKDSEEASWLEWCEQGRVVEEVGEVQDLEFFFEMGNH